MISIASGLGPMKTTPASAQALAKAAFSARKPKPGWTACAPSAARHPAHARSTGSSGGGAAEAHRLVGEADVHGIRVGVAEDGDRADAEAPSVRMMRTAISPRLATSTFVMVVMRSHPEDAVAGVGHRDTGDDVEGEAEHVAGLRGLDHAVVPEPRGGVVGAALAFVLVADGRSNAAFSSSVQAAGGAELLARTVDSTDAACAPPITDTRAPGHSQRKRGE
jgi:hypothetical protein